MFSRKPRIRLYIFLSIISVILSVSVTLIIHSSINQYDLEIIKEQPLKGLRHDNFIYHDFDKDGVSETVNIVNSMESKEHLIKVFNYSDNNIDQLNYFESVDFSIGRESILFEDYDGDNLDDVFTLTQVEDSLFLYMHDLRLKKVIINRHFLLETRPPYFRSANIFRIKGMKLITLNGEKKVLLFSVCSDRSIQPRGVYLFDIEKLQIIKRFEADANFANILMYDLTGDGKDEIILTTDATGNVHYKSEYTDQKCWLFILDQDLNNIFEPMSFGEYGSGLACNPIEIQFEKYLLITQQFGGNKNLNDALYFINSRGQILRKKEMKFSTRNSFFKPLIVEKKEGNIKIYTWLGNDEIILLDKNLNIEKQITTGFVKIVPYAIKDLNPDGKNEIICMANNGLLILGDKLELLASINEPLFNYKTLISFRENGKGKPIDIGLNNGDKFRLYAFKNNYVYASLPFIAVGSSLLLFISLLAIYLMLARIFAFSKYHRFSLVNSNEGAIMLDYFGAVKNYNEKAKIIFNLNGNSKKNNYFNIKLVEFPRLVALIEESMKTNSVVKECLVIPNANTIHEGDICITPIFSKFKILRSYLVEFQDYNSSVVSSKLIIWSKAAQRMVHDIKYPLSVAAVKLDTLKTRIDALSIRYDDKINDDFEVIKSEIKRVNSIAKSFLKFSELEKPNFQAVCVNDIIKNCVKRYEGFINEKLKIQTAIDDDVETIWADEQQIELALHNLIENSIDAINGEGFILISASLAQYLDDSLVERVEIEVADTGPGIDEKIRENIFQPYITTKTDGTGIGLAIVRKIIEDHGSKIDFYSKPGFGTVVRFSIKVPMKLNN